MKKVYLLKVTQNGHERYIGSADARVLVEMARKAELKAVQDAQRPIDPHRLEDLSVFIKNEGTLSTSLVIGTIDDRIKVYPVSESDKGGILYYTEFLETKEELEKMRDVFYVMDGQHRLFSFMPEYIKIADGVKFELSFEMYIRPTLKEQRIIFKNTNENQKPVPANLLMWFRAQLDMLSDKEKDYYNLVCMLNDEDSSPLKGRIIMSAERVVGGIKSQQLVTLFNNIQLKSSLNMKDANDDKLFKAVSTYLRGWEAAVESKFVDRERDLGAFSKIAGLRYMFGLLSAFYEVAARDRESFNGEFVKNKVIELYANLDNPTTPRDFFNMSSEYNKSTGPNPFLAEASTNALADFHKNILRNIGSNVFDPFA